MNMREVAFIICKNNSLWYEECIRYIQGLYIPENYSIDIISIEEAESAAAAYNLAMISSEAKYKVYLQEDVFILHRNFIVDILKIFRVDSSIGMIGMVGCRKLSADTVCPPHWDAGRALVYDGISVQDLDLRKDQDVACVAVEAVDGFIIVTQYDYEWQQEDLNRGYSCAVLQSLEMCRHGRKTVVPWQAEPWCYHDCGVENGHGLEEVYAQLIKIVEAGAFDEIWSMVDEIQELPNREIREIANLSEIYALEKASIQGISSEWWKMFDWGNIYEYYNRIRFALLRIEYRKSEEDTAVLKEMAERGSLHSDAVLHLASHTLPCTDRVYHELLKKENEEPLVGVVMPVYNGADFVEKSIESVLNQTYKNIEFIIVDDASTDCSRDVIRSYADSRIKTIFCEKNRNVVYSGNIGFEAAKGKYVALIGHDDLWEPDKLEKQISFLEEHPSYSLCFSYIDIINENLKVMKDSFWYSVFAKENRTAEAWSRKMFMNANCFCAPSACIRKSALDKAGYYRYALLLLQDYDLWLRVILEGEVYIYPEVLAYYRKFSDGTNLSAYSTEKKIRIAHEEQYVLNSYINNMPSDRFIKIFSKYMRDPETHDEKEILCEKLMILWDRDIYLARYGFAKILEDKECRQILEEKYQMDLNCFYRLNAVVGHFEISEIKNRLCM